MIFGIQITIQEQGGLSDLPSWLTSGPIPIILIIAAALAILGVWVNAHLNRIQRRLHSLGKGYYKKEEQVLNDYKSGLIDEREYRRRHERLVQEMREDSRRMIDGPTR